MELADRHDLPRAGVDRTLEQLVRIFDVDLRDQSVGSPAVHRFAEIERRVPSLSLTMRNLSVRHCQAVALRGAECLPEKRHSCLDVVYNNGWRYRVKPFRNPMLMLIDQL